MAIDSGDTAMMGLIIGGAAGWVLSDGEPLVAVLGAGAGWAIGGPGGESAGMAQPENDESSVDVIDETIEKSDLRDPSEFKVDGPLD